MFRTNTLPASDIYVLLANSRRRETLRQLSDARSGGPVPLGELATAIAARETEASPPPRAARESVYNALHQTHLPTLEAKGVIEYDREKKTVRLYDCAREVGRYMEVVTRYGITWSELYRTLGVGALAVVVSALADVPVVSAVDPLLWASGFLLVFATAITAQLWTSRWHRLRTRAR